MRREVGANYFSDPDHKIEHTRAEFRAEASQGGLEIEELTICGARFWASLRPVTQA